MSGFLRLVKSFNEADYTPPFLVDYEDKFNPTDRANVFNRLVRAAEFAGYDPENYTIRDEGPYAAFYITEQEDREKFSAAFNHSQPFEIDYLTGDETYNNRDMDRYRRSIMRRVGETELRGKIETTLRRREKTVVVSAETGFDFIVFDKLYQGRLTPRQVAEVYDHGM